MSKFFNKWTRKFHRWIAIPTVIIIPLAVISKFTADASEHLPPQLEQFQSILMLLLVISGSYLYLIPYLTKWKRNRRKKAKQQVN
jgi:protein-S-isoprenylcysteine O-methyltransferase Ste14